MRKLEAMTNIATTHARSDKNLHEELLAFEMGVGSELPKFTETATSKTL